ncbi:hypothetical protein ETB97_006183 [Aspergillus alliaceus]|uniref:Uncharacterized protein n=1 Tax=Petromyces alliaceus TaxID=209559 RepID=A0A8H6E2K3_PETAA|nr:hypothetical protein ETB97_006183 [Aspergillus burnettii]
MEPIASHGEIISAFEKLVLTMTPPNLCLTDLHLNVSAWMGSKFFPRPDSNILQLPAIFLNSTDPFAFLLGLGLSLVLSGQKLSNFDYLGEPPQAQALHSLIRGNIRCDKKTKLLVTVCTAKEALRLEFPERDKITVIRRFFSQVIQIDTFPLPLCRELRKYAELRCRSINHDLSIREVFAKSINIWLFLYHIKALVIQVSEVEDPIPLDMAHVLSNALLSTADFLHILATDLWIEKPVDRIAFTHIHQIFALHGLLGMVHQGLKLAVSSGQTSAFRQSMAVLDQS